MMNFNSDSHSTRCSRSPPDDSSSSLGSRASHCLSRITAVGVGHHLDVVAFNIAAKKDTEALQLCRCPKVSVGVELHVKDGGVIEQKKGTPTLLQLAPITISSPRSSPRNVVGGGGGAFYLEWVREMR